MSNILFDKSISYPIFCLFLFASFNMHLIFFSQYYCLYWLHPYVRNLNINATIGSAGDNKSIGYAGGPCVGFETSAEIEQDDDDQGCVSVDIPQVAMSYVLCWGLAIAILSTYVHILSVKLIKSYQKNVILNN